MDSPSTTERVVIIIQEEIENRTIALVVKTGKLTAQALAKIFTKALREMEKQRAKGLTPHGRQTVKQLMNHGAATSTIPLDGETRQFDRIARKWNVDYAFYKTGRNKHLLLFKSGQADAITACLSDYTKQMLRRAKDKRTPVLEQLETVGKSRTKQPLEHERIREVAHIER